MNIEALPLAANLLGESPLWHPKEQVLYWVDIPGRRLHCYDPVSGAHREWSFDADLGCCAATSDGRLLVTRRDGLVLFDPADSSQTPLAAVPYDPAIERFNDGKVDPQGRFWVGTIYEPRDAPKAALYRLDAGGLRLQYSDATVSNGLAWSADGDRVYWADTKAHVVYQLAFDPVKGQLGPREVFARFAPKNDNAPALYGGRPDGAAVDSEGCYWVAMFEGARLLRFSPAGELLLTVPLPVRCPTMPCFGGPDLRTLYVTTSRENRSAAELEAMPWSGRVLHMRVDVPGLPASIAKLP
jgi:sugar lactone lactonase YvrE